MDMYPLMVHITTKQDSKDGLRRGAITPTMVWLRHRAPASVEAKSQ